ncbi:hypothetical protein Bca52824_031864 [Brassica carinata]|uniref:Neprosin domain-containing protein n=1 Tax=Brassica carinata TaxID=52824 RepID=A0A8X7SBN1_BRACI|nr:hypothetical protein Bca52824_031864 [Brassica carinata]
MALISENVTYDCIDIYKQPGLKHPLLKTHKIQMKSSVSISRPELKMQTGENKTSNKKKIECPNGTVPILKNTKEYVKNSQVFVEKHLHPLSADSPGLHIAGVRSIGGPFRGVEAWFSGNALNVGKDQVSYSHIYIGSRSENQINYISAGWIINPSLYGDQRVWTFGFWKGKDGKGCYNTACSGFVQVSKVIPIVEPNVLKPGVPRWLRYSIHQPPMGNGILPNGGPQDSGVFTNIEVLNSNYEQRKMDSFPFESLADCAKCYGLRIGSQKRYPHLGFFFNYGGLGGNECGV